MSTDAIAMMVVALLIVWGGMVASILALRARPERTDFPSDGPDRHGGDDAVSGRDA